MEYQKIKNLLRTTPDEKSRFITKKWVEIHDQSGNAEDRYKPSKQIRFKTSMLRSDLCDFSDAYIVVKGKVTDSFNPRRGNYDNNDFPDDLFRNNIFPERSTDAQVTTARNATRTNAVNAANATAADDKVIEKTSLKVFLLETMLHLSIVIRKLIGH